MSGTNGSIRWTNNEGFFEPISQRVAWAGAEKNCCGFELLQKTGIFMTTCKGGATGGVSGALTPQIFNFGTTQICAG